MIRVKYEKDNRMYIMRMFQNEFGNINSINMKFDTGASVTLISIWSFFLRLSISDIRRLEKGFREANIKVRGFNSASGDVISGYPCMIHDIKLSDIEISKFHFYLALDVNRPVSLIGDDFISCCKFEHDIGGDIVISKYDEDRAYSMFQSLNDSERIFSLNEIYEMGAE